MSRIKIYLAYAWALAAAPLLLATLMGMPFWAEKLVAFTGLHVHPTYTGGEVVRTIEHGQYRTLVHRPVFDGLVGRRKHGFVQIKWQPADASLPQIIDERIDFDDDGTPDFRIQLNTETGSAHLEASDSRVVSIGEVLKVENTRIVRVNLTKTTRP